MSNRKKSIIAIVAIVILIISLWILLILNDGNGFMSELIGISIVILVIAVFMFLYKGDSFCRVLGIRNKQITSWFS